MRHEGPILNVPIKSTAEKLVTLLDYVEEVVKLDERVAFRLADYRLPDGSTFAVTRDECEGLPGVGHESRDAEGVVWLSVERLARQEPPVPPPALLPWLRLGSDPSTPVEILAERLVSVTPVERQALLEAGTATEGDFLEAPARAAAIGDPGAASAAAASPPADAPQQIFDRRRRLADQSGLEAAIEAWIAGPHAAWAADERVRRRTIALYGRLYKLQQQLEIGGADGALEAIFGIGMLRWHKDGRVIHRPFIERSVELELDADGLIRVRPRVGEPRVDLKPFEDFGCDNLSPLEDLVRREIARADADDGVSPYRRDSFEPILVGAATRLAANGRYRPGAAADPAAAAEPAAEDATAGPVLSDAWVLFARPRSAHVLLDDIERFRGLARAGNSIEGLAARLVTPPAAVSSEPWMPLGPTLGGLRPDAFGTTPDLPRLDEPDFGEVFFPKSFNEDQLAIVARLRRADGLVVQGPPGTGKTHTIANLICHALALGQRVLVVSRGEAALAVLREQLPEKVRPLTIAILSSERQGLAQVETAIREIQAVVEESRPEIRHSAIRRCEAEIVKIRHRLATIDQELDTIAQVQIAPLGPEAESPAVLALRLARAEPEHRWFTDRPLAFWNETGLTEADLTALAEARRLVGARLDHIDAEWPGPADLPDVATILGWHADLARARNLAEATGRGPAQGLRLTEATLGLGERCRYLLRELAEARETVARQAAWLTPCLGATLRRDRANETWTVLFETLCADWRAAEAARARLAIQAIELPEGLIDDETACAAVQRAALGERPWPRLALGRAESKARFAAIRRRGFSPGEDREAWRAVAEAIMAATERRSLGARWRSFAAGLAEVQGAEASVLGAAARLLALADELVPVLAAVAGPGGPPIAVLAEDPGLARALAAQVEGAVAVIRLTGAREACRRLEDRFTGSARTVAMARQVFGQLVGRADVEADRLAAVGAALLAQIAALHDCASAFHTIREMTARIAAAGAPDWAGRLRGTPASPEAQDGLGPEGRAAWDWAAGRAHLQRVDGRERLLALGRERDAADRRCRKLFVELVRDRAFHALDRRLSPRVKSALVEYVRALGRLGKGTGKGAGRHRRAARDAMGRCYDAVPCWIMPTWRVAEQLPADLAAFDLVILDEASQSDVTELPALLRGRKILAVGDDRQVSPTPPFVTRLKIDQLRHHYLRHLPFASLLEPGESLYDLMRAVFPDSRLMLKEHFRCVEPIIRFSMQFYPEKLVPLRVPRSEERLDPPLVDIFVPHGAREASRKINRAEAEVIAAEIAAIAADPRLALRTIGVISLIGGEQAELVRVLLAERIGEAAMQRHAILCGDSATFQGNERDIVFLSMVADRKRRTALTMLRYEQRFNVAASRARDRLVLVRSVQPEDLSPRDLKARLIAHFADPLAGARVAPAEDLLDFCESDFERDMMRRLLGLGYRVVPQVGAEGFRIDLVVEGFEGRRLAVECDGDRFHGPEQWRDDMRRQRILERVGWRFWRCFASSFYTDPEGVMADLVGVLIELDIEPVGAAPGPGRATEHRVAPPPAGVVGPASAAAQPELPFAAPATEVPGPKDDARIGIGDRVALLFPDRRRLTLRLTNGAEDEALGFVSIETPLGLALRGAEEGDEIELPHANGPPTRVFVEAVEKAA